MFHINVVKINNVKYINYIWYNGNNILDYQQRSANKRRMFNVIGTGTHNKCANILIALSTMCVVIDYDITTHTRSKQLWPL